MNTRILVSPILALGKQKTPRTRKKGSVLGDKETVQVRTLLPKSASPTAWPWLSHGHFHSPSHPPFSPDCSITHHPAEPSIHSVSPAFLSPAYMLIAAHMALLNKSFSDNFTLASKLSKLQLSHYIQTFYTSKRSRGSLEPSTCLLGKFKAWLNYLKVSWER